MLFFKESKYHKFGDRRFIQILTLINLNTKS